MIAIHIGLGKTGTTSLQKFVFPKLTEMIPRLTYNHPEIIKILIKSSYFDLTSAEINYIQKILSSGDHFISLESLAGWNPRSWLDAAEKNLEIFGKKSIIIITIRDSVQYLTSVYQQMISAGKIMRPENFFINKTAYDNISSAISKKTLLYYDVDSFDLTYLAHIYKKKFTNVHIVPMEIIGEFFFLKEIFNLSGDQILTLQNTYKNSKKENRSYSQLAMNLTLFREKMLNFIGVRSVSSNDRNLIELYQRLSTQTGNTTEKVNLKKRNYAFFYSSKHLLSSIKTKICHTSRSHWRIFIQNYFDKIIPYKKYKLPSCAYINNDMTEKNDKFIKSIIKKHKDKVKTKMYGEIHFD